MNTRINENWTPQRLRHWIRSSASIYKQDVTYKQARGFACDIQNILSTAQLQTGNIVDIPMRKVLS
jgi:hypothetical protein